MNIINIEEDNQPKSDQTADWILRNHSAQLVLEQSKVDLFFVQTLHNYEKSI